MSREGAIEWVWGLSSIMRFVVSGKDVPARMHKFSLTRQGRAHMHMSDHRFEIVRARVQGHMPSKANKLRLKNSTLDSLVSFSLKSSSPYSIPATFQ
jgi:hypothetical protein